MKDLLYNPHYRVSPLHLAVIRIATGLWLVALFIGWSIEMRWSMASFSIPRDGATFRDVVAGMQSSHIFFVSAVAAAILLILGIGRRIIAFLLLLRMLILAYPAFLWSVELFPQGFVVIAALVLLLFAGRGDAFPALRTRERLREAHGAWLLFLMLVLAGIPFFAALNSGGEEICHALESFGESFGAGLTVLPLVVFILQGFLPLPLALFRRTRSWAMFFLLQFFLGWLLISAVIIPAVEGEAADPVSTLQVIGCLVLAALCLDPSWLKPKAEGKNVVLYDGLCGLCNRSVQLLLAEDHDKVMSFAPLQGTTAKGIDADQADSLVYVRDVGAEGEEVFVASEAVLRIAEDLGGFAKLFAALLLIPVPLRDRVYRLVAKYRYRLFGRLASCPLPRDDEQDRFLP